MRALRLVDSMVYDVSNPSGADLNHQIPKPCSASLNRTVAAVYLTRSIVRLMSSPVLLLGRVASAQSKVADHPDFPTD